jgi:hypothetical protein
MSRRKRKREKDMRAYQRQARVLTPPMFMEHEPQIPKGGSGYRQQLGTQTLAAGAAECERGVDLVLDLQQRIEHHGAAPVDVMTRTPLQHTYFFRSTWKFS